MVVEVVVAQALVATQAVAALIVANIDQVVVTGRYTYDSDATTMNCDTGDVYLPDL